LQAVYILDKTERFAGSRLAQYRSPCDDRLVSNRQRKTKKIWTCDDCFFRCRGLCALDLAEPCSTFRLNRPEGLVPPRQPALLMREPEAPSEIAPSGGLA
jgi:hypothetical protein